MVPADPKVEYKKRTNHQGSRRGSPMTTYHQFCPIARASEILAQPWTLIIVRNLLIGCNTFTEIQKGAPFISKSLLSKRLRSLERHEILERRPNPSGRGSTYELTPSGLELLDVVFAMGKWGMRWLEVAPEHLDPGMVLWALGKSVIHERLPDRRLVVRFTFTGRPRLTLWALAEHGELEACLKHPGGDEDLIVTADPEWFVRWHFRRCTWAEALRGNHIVVDGPRALAREFPNWFAPDAFSEIEPAKR
jgi:DNA-binding HxlR family transcriptional regulator